MVILKRDFYNQSPLVVAPKLLGKILTRRIGKKILSGRIVEVEAYLAFEDEASHSFKGKPLKNASLFKASGHTYIHSIHI